jgi:hypothetical protein
MIAELASASHGTAVTARGARNSLGSSLRMYPSMTARTLASLSTTEISIRGCVGAPPSSRRRRSA